MRARLFQLMSNIRASYWFVPSVMALLAIGLGAVMVWIDAGPGAGLLDGLGWVQKAKPAGAREVLSTIAGSMITVAGVVFSITIVTIAYAASQYGPRILTNFMSDRGNQVTLGTFIATFVYCLVVLRTIRSGDEGQFVPQLAVMVGLFLALCSIAVLIFFIHHVPRSIHINNVVAQIGKQLLRAVEQRFPAQPCDLSIKEGAHGPAEYGETAEIESAADGYIEALDDETLMVTASEQNLTIELHRGPGEYMLRGQSLMSVRSAQAINDAIKRTLRHSFSIGNSRTPAQDMYFLVDELVEVAARALSPGINDPYTAMTCLDWLAAATAEVGRRHAPAAQWVDKEGAARVIALPQSFAAFVDRGFGRMRQYLARDMNAAARAFDNLAAAGRMSVGAGCRQALAREASKLLMLVEDELHGPSRDTAREHCRAALKALDFKPAQTVPAGNIGLRKP